HVLAMPFMVLWVAALVDGAAAGRPPRWRLLPVMVLWANLHGGFTIGLGIAGLLAVEAVMGAPARPGALGRLRSWGGFLAATLASTLVSPHPLGSLAFTTKVLGLNYSLSVIDEWRSPDFHALQPLELWLLLAVALALTKGLRLPPVRLVLL